MSDFIYDNFLRDIIQTPNREKCISSLLAQYTYRNGYLLNIISTCGFKIYMKFSYLSPACTFKVVDSSLLSTPMSDLNKMHSCSVPVKLKLKKNIHAGFKRKTSFLLR